jgi:rfaE bifunctional protein kinase chain/domain
MDGLSRTRLVEILDRSRSLRVGVVGDFNLDADWHADMTRSQLSRETPLFPRPVLRESYSGGGAANAAWNLAALEVGEVQAFGILGKDWRGDLLAKFLEKVGVNLTPVLWRDDWKTPLYGKVLLQAYGLEQEDARLDFVNDQPLPASVTAELLERIEAALPALNAVVVADYQPIGILSDELRAALNHLAATHPEVCFVADSRDHVGSFSQMVIKPNKLEAVRLLFPDRPAAAVDPEALAAAGLRWHQTTGKPLVITLGEQGCLLWEAGVGQRIPAVKVALPIDPVGAGDTFLAALAASLAAKATLREACAVATLATAVTIRCLRTTGTASPSQILDQFQHLGPEAQ